MKKCPFCGAEIEESSRFCLYCMSPLDEKRVVEIKNKSRRTTVAVIASVLVLVIALTLLFVALAGNDDRNAGSYDDAASSAASDALDASVVESNNESTNESTNESVDESTNESVDESTNNPSESVSESVSGDASDGDNAEPEPEYHFPPIHATTDIVEYSYREATWADDLRGSESRTENGVVITAVNTVSPDGVYIIPETIDGYRVVGILDGTFGEEHIRDTVKVVVIPKHVSTIACDALRFCYNLTDLYICGEELGAPASFFPVKEYRRATLTVHCSSECHNRDHRTFKSLCDGGEAEYEEWYNEK